MANWPKNQIYAIFLIFFLSFMTSCANGPARYKTLGQHKYATYEFTKRSHPIIKPLSAVGGIVTDATLVILDTGVNLIAAIPLTVTHGGPDGNGFSIKEEPYALLFTPFWYPFTYIATGIWPKEVNEDIYGKESGLFLEIE